MTMQEETKRLSPPTSPWNLLENQSTTNKRKNRAIVVHVMDFILTMIGCIVLDIDHRSIDRRFDKIFTPNCMKTIRTDIENLMRFERKHVDTFILALIKIHSANDDQICSRVKRNHPFAGYCRKKDIRFEILRVVNSMIFRRGAGTIFRSNDEESSKISSFRIGKNTGRSITDFRCYVEYPRKVRIIAPAEPRRKIANSTDRELPRSKDRRRSRDLLEDIVIVGDEDVVLVKNLMDFKKHLSDRKNGTNRLTDRNSTKSTDFEIPASEDGAVNGHVCNRVDCPLCYGWLWLPICYCVYTIVKIVVDLVGDFVNGILGYFGESHVREVGNAR